MAVLVAFVVAVFLVFFLFLLPIILSLRAVGSLFVYPGQLRTVFGNRILRRNHALEHATIATMLEKEPGRPLSGFSTDDGFFVQGARSLDEVDAAARAALARLKGGERSLAVHRNCGTTIVASNLLAAVFFLAAVALGLYLGGWWIYGLIVSGIVLAFALRVPLSLFLQRFVTTDANLNDAEVGWVEPARPEDLRSGLLGMLLAASTVRVRVFHTDPDAVEVLRGDETVVR
ncbi:Hypothetical Protein RradSPS_1991 [Rubrobacter radiotolerans]|uniref:DUF6391 domain-containing protein n=1 Tax=Rubrobacter radiotolerans TaxID=42256 RepID=A0A023X5C7_RUBRA|nr:DUF6391 domain-containing protein [Rubrobacter radiotolerans]AHY47274.1 Hypothetical Protein RradSPS_1991 [Rubrobacter radiotolerans]MDX5894679.1 DUF6391 domain-containing protein [Rubrobacter radiotolerans]SMC06524.1 conserved hypothetical protein [Rubrobacter radiotolerans DSM 5868]